MSRKANPFDDPTVVSGYEVWYAGRGQEADAAEKALLEKLLAGFPRAQTALEVGCGTGHFTRWLASKGFQAVGLDLSQAMLTEAQRRHSPPCIQGDALAMPFGDRAFDLAVLITTLEFISEPVGALTEAARVARQGLLLGVLNRWSVLALCYRASRKAVWQSARFFSPRQLVQLTRAATGPRVKSIWWRTALWPLPGLTDLALPWGGFIGLAVELDGDSPAGLR